MSFSKSMSAKYGLKSLTVTLHLTISKYFSVRSIEISPDASISPN